MQLHKNCNTQRQIYAKQRLEKEIGKTCETCKLVKDRRPCLHVPVELIAIITLLILRNM